MLHIAYCTYDSCLVAEIYKLHSAYAERPMFSAHSLPPLPIPSSNSLQALLSVSLRASYKYGAKYTYGFMFLAFVSDTFFPYGSFTVERDPLLTQNWLIWFHQDKRAQQSVWMSVLQPLHHPKDCKNVNVWLCCSNEWCSMRLHGKTILWFGELLIFN